MLLHTPLLRGRISLSIRRLLLCRAANGSQYKLCHGETTQECLL